MLTYMWEVYIHQVTTAVITFPIPEKDQGIQKSIEKSSMEKASTLLKDLWKKDGASLFFGDMTFGRLLISQRRDTYPCALKQNN